MKANVPVYLYQWTDLASDFDDYEKLGRLGGNGNSANKFRGIEREVRDQPNEARWLIAARRKNQIWQISGLLKVRLPTDDEARTILPADKYLYLDEVESGFVALPGEHPLVVESIDKALRAKLPGQTEGMNGLQFLVPKNEIEKLQQAVKLTIRARKEQLRPATLPRDIEDPRMPEFVLETNAPASTVEHPPESRSESFAMGVGIEGHEKLMADTFQLSTAEREAVVKVRVGQGRFRERLVGVAGERCWMSGIEGRQLLVASHIKPWAHCEGDPESREMEDNGLLLSALWDAAFDTGLLTISSDWKVISSSLLSDSARMALTLNEASELPIEFRSKKRFDFLAYHRQHVFERWEKSELENAQA